MRTFFRVFFASWRQLVRHAWVSIATLMAFCLALFSLQALMGLQILAERMISEAEQRVDMTIVFKPGTPDAVFAQARGFVAVLPETSSVDALTAAQSLEAFRARHQQNDQILSALQEVGRNPLGARMIIQAKSLEGYPILVKAIQSSAYAAWIQDPTYRDHQEVIQRLQGIRRSIRLIGSALVLFFVLVGLLMAFNAVRLAVFTQREEIAIMRLVGASRFYIRTPFVLTTLWIALFSVGLTALLSRYAVQRLDPWLATQLATGSTGLTLFMNQYGTTVLLGETAVLALATMCVSGIAVGRYIKR